jgi:ATP-dependent helicase HrpB
LLTRSELPIDALLPEIVSTIRQHPITLLEAEPGAGKTTRVPPALLDAGFAHVYVLEPRRIAARMAARRAAEEGGERLGDRVGYQVRFEEQSSANTKLWFLTEGVLTRKFAADPALVHAQVVLLDEFHERHLETDLALALLRRLQRTRPELKLLLMSATLGGEALRERLGSTVPLLRSSGRQFPVDLRYTPASAALLEERVSAAVDLAASETDGHVLVFLPGAAEIRKSMQACEGIARRASAQLMPLHGDLPPGEQDRVVAPSQRRKIILSTNVAESSITIDGVRSIVDSGLARVASWSPWSGLSRLRIEKISRSSAVQRAGRAGRTAPGLAIRLYSEEDFRRRPELTLPEILRADLSPALLQLAAMGIACEELPWLESPPPESLDRARELLMRLGAFLKGNLTEEGRHMSAVPVHPRLARFCLEAGRRRAGKPAAVIAAQLSEGRLRFDSQQRKNFVSDVDMLAGLHQSSNAARLAQQILCALPRSRKTEDDSHAIEKALLYGYPDRVARRRGETLLMSSGGSARLDRESAVHSEFLIAVEVEDRPEQGMPLVRVACPIEPDWLLDMFPERIATRDVLDWNRNAERVEQVSALLYDELVIDESRQPPADAVAATALLAQKAVENGVEKFTDRKALDRFVARVRFAAQHSRDFVVPADLVQDALRELATGLHSFSELRQAASNGGLEQAMNTLLPVRLIDELAPTHVRLPGGRRAPIEYSEHHPPSVASRLQDFFGMRETPRVASGAVPLVVHLLAPNRRPVQMTQDLESFWKNLYPQVRRELSRRYPKHKWPEDPYQTVASV